VSKEYCRPNQQETGLIKSNTVPAGSIISTIS